jgi:sec-independent protein translocase protein TatB
MEIVVIAVVSLIFIGPSRLPETAKQMGKLFVKFRRATSEARSVVDDVIREAEREVVLEEHTKADEQAALDTGSAQID